MPTRIEEDRITAAYREGKAVEIRGHILTPVFQERLELAVRAALGQAGRGSLHPVVYAVAQELTLWASLSNMRQVYFEENSLDLHDAPVVSENESAFQASVTGASEEYRRKCVERELFLRTRISTGQAGMQIIVTNNATHSVPTEDRLRAQLKKSMQYSSIMDYFEDNPDDQLGRGMGLAFSILMLREEGLRPELMRMGRQGERLISRVEIPFEAEYSSIRDRIERGEEIRPFDQRELIPGRLQLQDVVYVSCPVCERKVDERVFFPELTDDMININSVWLIRPSWQYSQGACASCLATHDADDPSR